METEAADVSERPLPSARCPGCSLACSPLLCGLAHLGLSVLIHTAGIKIL